ncbi:selenoprotein M [Leptinotarsa decemlineata]|uniref:selenoprotein M n=1 Tax=Leptinotarsa decemlineata TaxID=7539 RepID=UPI000C2532B6|nr:selenoprotein M-like [Leptinotarsa decemlineata]
MKLTGTILFLTFILFCNGTIENKIVKARLESCPGCSLNRLHDVKKFVYEDIGKYDNVEWKKISGAPPELIFYNSADEEVERHQLSKLSRKECNELLNSKGFSMRTNDKEL